MFYLITQRHPEDGTLEQELYEAGTWQEALTMAQLGWVLEPGVVTFHAAIVALATEGWSVMMRIVESYTDYHGNTKIRLKEII